MRKISITLMTMLLATGVALAQDKDKTKTGGTGTTGTTTTTKTTTTTTTKTTGAKTDPKLGDKGAKEAAKTDPKATGAAAEPAMPTKPTIPQQVTDLAKANRGTWRCTGDMMGPDGNPAYKMKATITNTVDATLGKMFIKTTFKETKQKAVKYPFGFTAYSTFNTADNKWHQVMVDNWGGIGRGTSTGADANGKVTWEMDVTSSMGSGKMREYEEPATIGKKKGVHMWGEMSMDGKTWMKVYDMNCTK